MPSCRVILCQEGRKVQQVGCSRHSCQRKAFIGMLVSEPDSQNRQALEMQGQTREPVLLKLN